MVSPFLEMIEGRVPYLRVLENEEFLAFLSETPIRSGHCLVIPKKAVDALFEMEDGALGRLMVFAKQTARLIQSVIPCTKIGLMAAGIQVRHAHLHLIPIDQPADLDFSKQKPADASELKKIAEAIQKIKVE